MGLWRFSIYTLLGSYPWCLALAFAGMKLGEHWRDLAPYFHRFDNLIAVLLLVASRGLCLCPVARPQPGARPRAAAGSHSER